LACRLESAGVTAYGETQVRAALRRVWPDAATVETAEIRALGGGSEPRTFLAVAGPLRYVLRVPLASLPPLLDLATEARAMRAAAAAGLAPRVVAVDLDEALLLTEYYSGSWTPELVRRPHAIATIARALRSLHRLDVDVPVYAVASIAARYLAELQSGGARLRPRELDWADELMGLGRDFDAAYPPTAFCHNDLAAANILTDAAAARFIDFEYAGRGTPLLDLASFAGMNGLAEDERERLLHEYYGNTAAPALRDLDRAIRMLWLLAFFWARVAERRAPRAQAPAQFITRIGAILRKSETWRR
jgi:aminoglycoside phosphotransferase (APT) family kinase protein